MLIDQFTLEMLPARYAGHISVRPSNKDEARAILASRGTHVVGLVERNKELGSPTPYYERLAMMSLAETASPGDKFVEMRRFGSIWTYKMIVIGSRMKPESVR